MVGMESQILRPGYLTAHQTARVLGVSLTGLRSIVHRGQLARAGGTPRQPWYAVDDVTALAADRRRTEAA
ncbi:hypothetical protein GCM10010499_43410 [Streptomyces thermoviolaceus subsp. apingens]|nr:hypothetical protein GCM10010499_43410 [Streptomyces thermoviolaceus subsp. apingens]